MQLFNQSQTKANRLSLRKNQTDAERSLWRKLRNRQMHGLKFFRQYGVGCYIVDFYCPVTKLVIEIDGGQHFEEKNMARDKEREEFMKRFGIKTIRVTNIDIKKNMDGVLKAIEGGTPPAPL